MHARAKKISVVLGILLGVALAAGLLTPGGLSLRLAAGAALCPLILVPFVIPRRRPRGKNADPPSTEKKTEPASPTPHAMGGNYA